MEFIIMLMAPIGVGLFFWLVLDMLGALLSDMLQTFYDFIKNL